MPDEGSCKACAFPLDQLLSIETFSRSDYSSEEAQRPNVMCAPLRTERSRKDGCKFGHS